MKLVESSIRFPVTVLVGAILFVLFGVIALLGIPLQMAPTVDRPVISVETVWLGAGTFSSITTEGVYTQDITGIKQRVRIAATLSGGSQGDFVVLVLRPDGISWRP